MIPRRWWPPVLWLGAILIATSLPGSILPKTDVPYADKMVHFAMYTILAFLLARAMRNPPRTTPLRVILGALLLVAAIGSLDEWHQRFVQGRTADLADWMTDSTGGLIGALIWAATDREKATRPA